MIARAWVRAHGDSRVGCCILTWIATPRTPVNKGKRKGQGCYAPALVRHVTLTVRRGAHNTRCHTLEERCLHSQRRPFPDPCWLATAGCRTPVLPPSSGLTDSETIADELNPLTMSHIGRISSNKPPGTS